MVIGIIDVFKLDSVIIVGLIKYVSPVHSSVGGLDNCRDTYSNKHPVRNFVLESLHIQIQFIIQRLDRLVSGNGACPYLSLCTQITY